MQCYMHCTVIQAYNRAEQNRTLHLTVAPPLFYNIFLFSLIICLIFALKESKGVLCVGLVCLDLVTVVDHFPKEDTDMRSSAQYKVKLFLKTVQKNRH